MLNLFRKNHFLNSLLLLPYALLLRVPLLLSSKRVDVSDSLVAEWLNLTQFSTFWHWILGSVLIFFQALTINRMIIKNRMGRDPSLFPGMTYILLSILFRETTVVSSDLIALSFFIPSVSYLFDIYKKYRVEMEMFNAGFLTGIAALIVPSFLLFGFVGLVSMLKLRAFRVVELLQYLNALILPFLLVWGILYLTDDQHLFYALFNDTGLSMQKLSELSGMGFFRWTLLFLALATTLFSFNGHMLKKSIQAQKKLESVYWILLLSFPVALLGPVLSDHDFLIFLFPTATLFGLLLFRIPNRSLAELIHLVLLGGALANHYFLWW